MYVSDLLNVTIVRVQVLYLTVPPHHLASEVAE